VDFLPIPPRIRIHSGEGEGGATIISISRDTEIFEENLAAKRRKRRKKEAGRIVAGISDCSMAGIAGK